MEYVSKKAPHTYLPVASKLVIGNPIYLVSKRIQNIIWFPSPLHHPLSPPTHISNPFSLSSPLPLPLPQLKPCDSPPAPWSSLLPRVSVFSPKTLQSSLHISARVFSKMLSGQNASPPIGLIQICYGDIKTHLWSSSFLATSSAISP